jgi:hypothetical protein
MRRVIHEQVVGKALSQRRRDAESRREEERTEMVFFALLCGLAESASSARVSFAISRKAAKPQRNAKKKKDFREFWAVMRGIS